MLRTSLIVCLCLLVISITPIWGAEFLDCEMYPIPEGTTSGSGYTALEVGLDGTVYIGTAWYHGWAHLVAFDPETKTMRDLADMQSVTHEHTTGINTQGKIHTDLVVAPDGKIYGGTKQADEIFDTRPEYGEQRDGYPGGHLFVYDPETGVTIDLGILKRQEGLFGGAMDTLRQRLYYWSFPKRHFLIYDIKTGKATDKGEIGSDSRHMVCTKEGIVYLPGRTSYPQVGKPIIVKYDPETDELYDIPVRVIGGEFKAPYAIVLGPDDAKMYGILMGHPYLMEFDLTSGSPMLMRHACRSISEGYSVGDIHTICRGKDGKIYWTCVGTSQETGQQGLHVCRYNPLTEEMEDLGEVRPTNMDAKPMYVQGSGVAPDGTLYLKTIDHPYSLLVFPRLTAPPGS